MEKNRLQKIYKKKDGRCHICHSKLCFNNYNLYGYNGAWQVEHSIAKANGGTNHMNNLYAACIFCNLSKGTRSTRVVRSFNGVSRAPYSKSKKQQIRNDNMTIGGLIGGLVGLPFGPIGIALGAGIGSSIGKGQSSKF